MPKATEALLKDHKMIRKILSELDTENPRFPQLLKTLQRVVLGHAWFEDTIFLPALEAEPLLAKRFTDEIYQEHKDIDYFLKVLRKTPPTQKLEIETTYLQLVTLLDTHFKKEEDALFPIAEKILDNEGLNNLGEEMERRKTEVHSVTEN